MERPLVGKPNPWLKITVKMINRTKLDPSWIIPKTENQGSILLESLNRQTQR